jgi:hypothetical protein
MKATFAVVNNTSTNLSTKGIIDVKFMVANGNGPTPNPTFGGEFFRGQLFFS